MSNRNSAGKEVTHLIGCKVWKNVQQCDFPSNEVWHDNCSCGYIKRNNILRGKYE